MAKIVFPLGLGRAEQLFLGETDTRWMIPRLVFNETELPKAPCFFGCFFCNAGCCLGLFYSFLKLASREYQFLYFKLPHVTLQSLARYSWNRKSIYNVLRLFYLLCASPKRPTLCFMITYEQNDRLQRRSPQNNQENKTRTRNSNRPHN